MRFHSRPDFQRDALPPAGCPQCGLAFRGSSRMDEHQQLPLNLSEASCLLSYRLPIQLLMGSPQLTPCISIL